MDGRQGSGASTSGTSVGLGGPLNCHTVTGGNRYVTVNNGICGQMNDPKSLREGQVLVWVQESPTGVTLALCERIRVVDLHCPGVPGDLDVAILTRGASFDKLLGLPEGVVALTVDFGSCWLDSYCNVAYLSVGVFEVVQGTAGSIDRSEFCKCNVGQYPSVVGALVIVVDVNCL